MLHKSKVITHKMHNGELYLKCRWRGFTAEMDSWQEATFSATLSLSDSTTRDVSTDSNTAYRVYSSALGSVPGGPAVEALVAVDGIRIARAAL